MMTRLITALNYLTSFVLGNHDGRYSRRTTVLFVLLAGFFFFFGLIFVGAVGMMAGG